MLITSEYVSAAPLTPTGGVVTFYHYGGKFKYKNKKLKHVIMNKISRKIMNAFRIPALVK